MLIGWRPGASLNARVRSLFAGLIPLLCGSPAAAVPPRAVQAALIQAPSRSAIIYIARRRWHIDIGFDVADLQSPLDSLAPQFPGVRYLFFGFGDQRYLLAKDRNAPVMLAALWPGRGMILATALKSSPDDAFGAAHVIALNVTRAELQAAFGFLQRTLGDVTAPIRPYAPGPYEGSLYLISRAKYSALHTCNTWAAEALKASGLPVHSVGVIFAGQLWMQARRLERQQAAAASPRASARSAQLQGGFVPS